MKQINSRGRTLYSSNFPFCPSPTVFSRQLFPNLSFEQRILCIERTLTGGCRTDEARSGVPGSKLQMSKKRSCGRLRNNVENIPIQQAQGQRVTTAKKEAKTSRCQAGDLWRKTTMHVSTCMCTTTAQGMYTLRLSCTFQLYTCWFVSHPPLPNIAL